MSNLNYNGSLANTDFEFSSTLQSVQETTTNLFNSIMVWVPASLANDNIADYQGEGLSATKPIVKPVTASNYTKVLKGELLKQWAPVFRDGTNFDVTMYLVVFYDTTFSVELGPTAIANTAMSNAFKKLYHLAYFKTLFNPDYTGASGSWMKEEPYTKVSPYFDMALCLAGLCESEPHLSMFLSYVQLDLSKITIEGSSIGEDTNVCNILSATVKAEEAAATTFSETTPDARAKNYWGFLKLLGGKRTGVLVNNGIYVDPVRLGAWYSAKNSSGTYIGNKLKRLKLDYPGIKPTGLPNDVAEDVNDNLTLPLAKSANSKNVAYLVSVSSKSDSVSCVYSDKTVSGFPINADMIAKYIDYTSSQRLADYSADVGTLNRPVLANRQTYSYIKDLVGSVINTASKSGRLTNINLSFPPYEEAKKGNKFVGAASWSARYVDDLEGVKISGSISFEVVTE